jgi:hypothetical protein
VNTFRLIFCAVFRHSRLLTNCFGYKYCARCGEQLGANTQDSSILPRFPRFYLDSSRLQGVC